jgi:hypothetical protein
MYQESYRPPSRDALMSLRGDFRQRDQCGQERPRAGANGTSSEFRRVSSNFQVDVRHFLDVAERYCRAPRSVSQEVTMPSSSPHRPDVDDRAHDRRLTGPHHPSVRSWWGPIVAMGVVILVAALMFALGRWSGMLGSEPESPPPSEAIPNAPGPDNDIRALPPGDGVAPSSSKDE